MTGAESTQVAHLVLAAGQQPFDLENGPLWRTHVFPEASSGGDILLLSFHHLIMDGRSMGWLLDAVENRYCTARNGKIKGEVPPRRTPGEFAHGEQQYLSGTTGEEDRAFWLGLHPDGFPPLNLPRAADKRTTGGEVLERTIPSELVCEVQRFAGAVGVTPQSVFLSVYAALLTRFGRQGAVTVGVAADIRPGVGFEETIGYFVNLLAIPVEVATGTTFHELLRQAFDRLLGALEHRRFPFRRLVQTLASQGKAADLSAAFYYQTWHGPEQRRWAERFLPGVHQTGEFDLVFEMIEASGDWGLHVKYRPSALSTLAAGHLADQFEAALRALLAAPEQCIDTAWPRQEDETGAAFVRPDDLRGECTHERIAARAALSPDAPAVLFGERWYSRGEMEARANQLAHHLRNMDVGPGSLVGVLMERSSEMLISLLAVWKAGAAYVPLDPAYPAERLRYILADAQIGTVLTQASCRFSSEGLRRVEVDREGRVIAAWPITAPPPVATAAEPLAYVIYTSGSTGRPKGVKISHRSLIHFLQSMAEKPGCTDQDYVLALTTISFDIAALELFLPLMVGAKVEIIPDSVARNGLRLRAKIENSPATLIQATPATWKMLLAAELGLIPRVRVLCGGEAWDEILASQLLERAHELWNMYGPTETTIWSSIQKVEAGQPVRLGEPIGNTQFYVFDEEMCPVPSGEIGELFIGGDGLSLGYLNQPELTRERFVAHPARPHERLYKTGDLVRHV